MYRCCGIADVLSCAFHALRPGMTISSNMGPKQCSCSCMGLALIHDSWRDGPLTFDPFLLVVCEGGVPVLQEPLPF